MMVGKWYKQFNWDPNHGGDLVYHIDTKFGLCQKCGKSSMGPAAFESETFCTEDHTKIPKI